MSAGLASAGAARTVYDCSFKDMDVNRNWLPTTVIISYAEEAEEAEVNDNIIQYENGGPMTVAIKKNTDAQFGLGWELGLESTMGRSLVVRYDFTYFKARGLARIKATFRGGPTNGLVAEGPCKVKQG